LLLSLVWIAVWFFAVTYGPLCASADPAGWLPTGVMSANDEDADDEEDEADKYPKFIVTLYNGGKVADIIEAEEFEYEKVSRITFKSQQGKKIHIIDGRIVIRETDKEDFAQLKSQREKTEKLRQLLALKRQQAALQEELEEQKRLAEELAQIEGKGKSTEKPSPKEPTPEDDEIVTEKAEIAEE